MVDGGTPRRGEPFNQAKEGTDVGDDARYVRIEARQGQTQPFWLHRGTRPPLFTYDPDARAVDVVPAVIAAVLAEGQDPMEGSRPRTTGGKHRRPRRTRWFNNTHLALVAGA